MAQRAVIWRTPFAAVELLDLLPGGSNSDARYCSGDGQTIVGYSDDAAGTPHAVKWDKTTLAVTQLPDLSGVACNFAFACAPDASVIFAHSDVISSQVVRYTGGGSGGTVLAPPAGYANVSYPFGWLVRYCSDDAVVACGVVSHSGGGGEAAHFDTTTATVLPRVAGIPDVNAYEARCVAEDASIIVGDDNFDISMFWRGTTVHRLKNPSALVVPGGGAFTNAYACNGDGTVVWGSGIDDSFPAQRACYWDSLTTLNGDGTYGTVHFLDPLISGTSNLPSGVAWCAETTTPIAVGAAGSAVGSSGVKWVGATATELPPLPGGTTAQANGCSGDGGLVVGQSADPTSAAWPVYWDTVADTTPHKLPTLPLETDGIAHGASRDGSLIYGYIDIGSETTLTDAELLFQPQDAFTDLSVLATRQLFISLGGTPQWMGPSGALPFGQQPAIYLTTQGPPLDFAGNNGDGGGFAPTGTLEAAAGPGCTPYIVTEATGPASDPQWRLTVSDDGGRTWSTLVKPRGIGKLGEYMTRLRWLKMGQSRQRIIKLECSDPVRRNIIGIYLDVSQGMS